MSPPGTYLLFMFFLKPRRNFTHTAYISCFVLKLFVKAVFPLQRQMGLFHTTIAALNLTFHETAFLVFFIYFGFLYIVLTFSAFGFLTAFSCSMALATMLPFSKNPTAGVYEDTEQDMECFLSFVFYFGHFLLKQRTVFVRPHP